MISKKAKASTGFQYLRTIRRLVRDSASGSSTAAPMRVRANTRTGTDRPSSEILMSRYGMPQITLIAAKSSQPRELTVHTLGGHRRLDPRRDVLVPWRTGVGVPPVGRRERVGG